MLHGALIVSPAPGTVHQRILGRLHVWLNEAAARAGSGEVVIAPADVRRSPFNLAQPDLLYLREPQSDLYGDAFIGGAPAFVIEIGSPSFGVYDRVHKASLYMASGVEEYWVVEPTKRHILVHLAGHDTSNPMIVASGAIASSVLPEFSFDVDDLFPSVADRPRTADSWSMSCLVGRNGSNLEYRLPAHTASADNSMPGIATATDRVFSCSLDDAIVCIEAIAFSTRQRSSSHTPVQGSR